MLRHSLWIVTLVGCVDAVDATQPETTFAPSQAVASTPPAPMTWRRIEHQPALEPAPFFPGQASLLTDGTVLVSDSDARWFKLVPDINGSYEHGTWKKLASSTNVGPSGFAPLYYGSATLPDGRFIAEGGEYNMGGSGVWQTLGAIYDPIADKWTSIAPPATWTTIGDASGIVLSDLTYMQSDCCSHTGLAQLNPTNLTWVSPVGTGKADIHDEESWAQMWDGRILTVDANNTADLDRSEIYDPATKVWTGHGDVPVHIADTTASNGGSHEVGPEIVRPDGKVVAIGGTGHNALYDPVADSWVALPDVPGTNQSADGPGVIMPNGKILLATSPGVFKAPVTFFELDGTTFTPVGASANSATNTSYQNFFLMLPNGEVLLSDQSGSLELYTPAPGTTPNAIPAIVAAPELIGDGPEASTGSEITMYRGRSYTVPIYRMNGISHGAYYGDDAQMSTNFPIIRVTNNNTGHVAFCRTYDHSNRSISPDSSGTTKLDVPANAEQGLSSLVSIANGIASAPITVNIK